MLTVDFAAGGFRYLPGPFQFSSGVAAFPGFRIERVTFREPVPLRDGFGRIEAIMAASGRSRTALCACELRSPIQMSEANFRAFNLAYVSTLKAWGIASEDTNPVARSNVCPAIAPPPEPCFHAFSYTVPDATAGPSFVIAGAAEVPDGVADYRAHVVRLDDTSPAGLTEKARFVLDKIRSRLGVLGLDWSAITALQIYTVHDYHHLVAEEIVRRGAGSRGISWHYCRPPVTGLDFEIDCRGVDCEHVV